MKIAAFVSLHTKQIHLRAPPASLQYVHDNAIRAASIQSYSFKHYIKHHYCFQIAYS